MTAATARPAQPAAAPALSPSEKRALREQARREFKAQEAARLAAAKAAEAGGTPAGTPAAPADPAAAPADPARTDAERARDAAVALRGVLMPIVAVLAGFFGYRLALDEFTEAQAAEDARAWVPILARYRWLDSAVTWASAPARLAARVRQLARKKDPTPAEPAPARKAVE